MVYLKQWDGPQSPIIAKVSSPRNVQGVPNITVNFLTGLNFPKSSLNFKQIAKSCGMIGET